MPFTSQLGLRPISPVEEELQKLFDEVLQGFADEDPPQSSERDLETIYNGYTDEYTQDYNLLAQPPQPRMSTLIVVVFVSSSRSLGPRSASPYRPPVDTTNIQNPSSIQSPTKRRLPPTPQSVISMPMPEPDPYYIPKMSSQKSYSSFSASQQDGSSPQSYKRRLPQEPGYINGVNSHSSKAQIPLQDPSTSSIPSSYTSHANSSYSTISTTLTFDKTNKSPDLGAQFPPATSGVYSDELEPYTQIHQPSYNPFNPYDQEDDLRYSKSQETSFSATPSASVPPPLPPKIPYSNYPVYEDSTHLSSREYPCCQ